MKIKNTSMIVCGLLTVTGMMLAGCDSAGTASPPSSSTAAAPATSTAPAPPPAPAATPDAPPAEKTTVADNKPAPAASTTSTAPAGKVEKSDAEWQKLLTPEQYFVARKAGTERPWTSPLNQEKRPGEYRCVGCNTLLFTSDTKFDSHCGWPSFFKPAENNKIGERIDKSHGMVRTEVFCNTCGAHLGHVFPDAPDQPGGLRYCINGVILNFTPKEGVARSDAPAAPAPDKK